jgi:AraC-like DNA-binding protein
MEALIIHLQRTMNTRSSHFRQFDPDLQIYAGVEDTAPTYSWDGRKRKADAAHPFIVFQYTLEGWGYYEDASGRYPIKPCMAFTAIVPSDHRYYRPPASSRWLVLWLVLHHPYIVQRVSRRQRECGPLLTLEPGHPLLLRAIELFEEEMRGASYDPITHEEQLFGFLWEYERAAERIRAHRFAQSRYERLLDEVRQYVLSAISRPISVMELAHHHGMSRSHFSRSFRAASGLSPAQYVQRVRLEAAAQRLLHSTQPISQIAQETGFANAQHFSRAFRQRFHLSPGAYRRQMR